MSDVSVTVSATPVTVTVPQGAQGPQGSQGPGGPVGGLTYATVAALEAATVPSDGTLAYVRGYAAANDGGQGYYRYSSGSSATVDHGLVATAAGGTGRWLRQHNGQIDAQWYGVVADGSTDNATALQAAIDGAQTLVSNNAGAPVINLPPGRIAIASGITWKSAALVGSISNAGTRIVWNGTAGATAFTKSTATGSMSFGRLENIEFVSGTAEPGTWLDLTAALIDVHLQLQRIQFSGGSIGIDIKTFVNAHWRDLRFDGQSSYAIRITPSLGANLGTFMLDGFTYDHARASSPGSGVVHIDNTVNSSNLGTVLIANGRIEVNAAWASPAAVAVITVPDSGANAKSVGLHFSDVTYQDVIGMSNDVLLYRDTANTSAQESLQLTNFRQSGLSALLGGTWPAGFATPPLQTNYGVLTMNIDFNQRGMIANSHALYGGSTSGIVGLTRVSGDAADRWDIRADGRQQWGDGTNAVDTNLYRSAANVLKTDDQMVASDGFVMKQKAGVPTDADLTVVSNGVLVVDTNDSKLYIRIGGSWKSVTLA